MKNLRSEIEKIVKINTEPIVKVIICPKNPAFQHQIGTGVKAQCYQCGIYFKTPIPILDEEKVSKLLNLFKSYLKSKPKYDLSKSGIEGEFYYKVDDLLADLSADKKV